MKNIKNSILAWSVHVLTASGLVIGFYSIISIVKEDYSVLLKLVFIGLLIDGIDGTIARKFKVKEIIPEIDGGLLDNIVDYLNYTFIPVMFFYYSDFIEDSYKIPICLGTMFASIYQFSRIDSKTEDEYFRGFPSLWSFFIISNLIFEMSSFLNVVLISIGIILSFLPIKFIYPSKTKEFRNVTLPLTVLTSTLIIIAILFNLPNYYLKIAKNIVLFYWSYLILMSLYLTYKTRNN